MASDPEALRDLNVANLVTIIAGRCGPPAFDAILTLLSARPVSLDGEVRESLLKALSATAAKGVTKEAAIAALGRLSAGDRLRYLGRVVLSCFEPDPSFVPLIRECLDPEGSSEAWWAALQSAEKAADPTLIPDLVSFWFGLPLQRWQIKGLADQLTKSLTSVAGRDPARAGALWADALVKHEARVLGCPQAWVGFQAIPPADALKAAAAALRGFKSKQAKINCVQQVFESVPGREADAWLLEAARADCEPWLASLVVGRLGRGVHEPALPWIGELLKHEDSELRNAAQKAMSCFKAQREALAEYQAWIEGDKESRAAVSELVKLLDSTNQDVVMAAAKSLGALKAKTALPGLVKRLDGASPELRAAINAAIDTMGR